MPLIEVPPPAIVAPASVSKNGASTVPGDASGWSLNLNFGTNSSGVVLTQSSRFFNPPPEAHLPHIANVTLNQMTTNATGVFQTGQSLTSDGRTVDEFVLRYEGGMPKSITYTKVDGAASSEPPEQFKTFIRLKEERAGLLLPQLSKVTLPNPYPTVAALDAISQKVGGNGEWSFPTPMSDLNPQSLHGLRADIAGPLAKYVVSTASVGSPEPVNAFFKNNGLPITLKNDGRTDSVYSGGLLKIDVEWTYGPGKETKLKVAGLDKEVDAAHISSGVSGINLRGRDKPLILLSTKGDERFVLVQLTPEEKALAKIDPRDLAMKFSSRIREDAKIGIEAQFPMVDFKRSGDLQALLGASTQSSDGRPATVTQAKFAETLQMDHIGAVVKSGVGLGVSRGLPPETVKIDGEFLVFVQIPNGGRNFYEAKGTLVPYAAFVTLTDMHKPKREK